MFDHPTARDVVTHLQGSRPAVALVGRSGGTLAFGNAEVEVTGVAMNLPMGVSSVAAMREISQLFDSLAIPMTKPIMVAKTIETDETNKVLIRPTKNVRPYE